MTDNVLRIDSQDGRPAVFVYETMAGVIFHVTPVSVPTLRAIQLRAQDELPYPDPKPYEIPDPIEVAFTPGQVAPASENPEYVKLCQAVDRKRNQWADKAIFTYAAKMPKYPTEQSLIDAYKGQLADLRKIAKFDESDSDYDLILLNFVLTGNSGGVSDYVQIIRLAIQTVALSASEVANGVRFFRPKV